MALICDLEYPQIKINYNCNHIKIIYKLCYNIENACIIMLNCNVKLK